MQTLVEDECWVMETLFADVEKESRDHGRSGMQRSYKTVNGGRWDAWFVALAVLGCSRLIAAREVCRLRKDMTGVKKWIFKHILEAAQHGNAVSQLSGER